MYSKQSKKVLPLAILEILQKYSDENHRLSQREIEHYLSDQFDMDVDRRSVKRGITDLIDLGLNIQYTEYARKVLDKQMGTKDEQVMLTDFYLERDFCDCEIRLLIDEILDSKYIPSHQRKELISKLERLSSVYFRKETKKTMVLYNNNDNDNQLFLTIEILNEAISSSCMVEFKYKSYISDPDGKIICEKVEYRVFPQDMFVEKGKYIILCDTEKGDPLSFRMDYISDVTIHEKRIMKSHTEMCEKLENVNFVTSDDGLDIFVEEFGMHNLHTYRDGNELVVKVKTDKKAALSFAINNTNNVEIISPKAYRNYVTDTLKNGLNRYDNKCFKE